MPGIADPSTEIDVRPEQVLSTAFGLAPVQPDPYGDGWPATPVSGTKSGLNGAGSVESALIGREHRTERVAGVAEHASAARLNARPHDLVVDPQTLGHSVGAAFPERGRSDDVGEEKRQRFCVPVGSGGSHAPEGTSFLPRRC